MIQLTLEQENVTVREFDESDDVAAADSLVQAIGTKPRRETGWITAALRQLRAIEQLACGWDSHGAQPPDAAIIKAARGLLEKLAGLNPAIQKPKIHPTPGGGVQFDWEVGPRYFEIELTDPATAHYFFEDREAKSEAENVIRFGQSMNQAIFYLRRVESHK